MFRFPPCSFKENVFAMLLLIYLQHKLFCFNCVKKKKKYLLKLYSSHYYCKKTERVDFVFNTSWSSLLLRLLWIIKLLSMLNECDCSGSMPAVFSLKSFFCSLICQNGEIKEGFENMKGFNLLYISYFFLFLTFCKPKKVEKTKDCKEDKNNVHCTKMEAEVSRSVRTGLDRGSVQVSFTPVGQ